MSIQYIHVRDTEIDDKGNTAPSLKGGATIAYEVTLIEGSENCLVRFNVALCHYKDNYNKKIGRMIAGGRLQSPRHQSTTLTLLPGESVASRLVAYYFEMQQAMPGAMDELG